MRFRWGLILLLALVALAPAWAQATRLVSTTGTDAGDCTGAACLTIQYAVNQAVAGDTIEVAAGTYNECVDTDGAALSFVASAFDGTAASRLLTVIDGNGVCGEMGCDGNETISCTEYADCEGTCDTEAGTCVNDAGTSCTEDYECDFGPCLQMMGEGSDAVLHLPPGSSVTGFTIRGGGYGGIYAMAPVTITQNVIEENGTWSWGGGITLVSYGNPGDGPYACTDEPGLACEGDADCNHCEQDVAVLCDGDEDCTTVEGDACAFNGPCITQVVSEIEGNLIRNNWLQSLEGGSGLGIAVGTYDDYEAGSLVRITQNVIEGNFPQDFGGGYTAYWTYGGGVALYAPYTVGQTRVEIGNNTVRENEAMWGGGILAYAYPGLGGETEVTITNNIIEGNHASELWTYYGYGYGGGIMSYATAYYAGDARIHVAENRVRRNSTGSGGGGITAWAVDSGYGAYFEGAAIDVTDNIVKQNTAGYDGGGIEAYVGSWASSGSYSYPRVVVEGNSVFENVAGYDNGEGSLYPWSGSGGGVGAYMQLYNQNPNAALRISGNEIHDNVAAQYGGAALLDAWFVYEGGEGSRQAPPELVFDHNLVMHNTASNMEETARGGGVYAYLQSLGYYGHAVTALDFNTIAENTGDWGGGVEVYEGGCSYYYCNDLYVTNSIIYGNNPMGIGAEANQYGVYIHVGYTDVFGSTGDNFERTLEYLYDEGGIIEEDPLLSDGIPDTCSPTIDAADPEADWSLEPAWNGMRANMGHTGGTENATASLPDLNDDGAVNGADILVLATAFGSEPEAARWLEYVDLDQNNIIDGDDLAAVTALWGVACP